MRIAFVGKGGAGKSAISGTLCRCFGRLGVPVLAMDVDTMPGLAYSIGVPLGSGRLPTGLAELVERKRGRRWKMVKGAGAASLVDTHGVRGPDGIRFLELGKLPEMVQPSSTVAFRSVLERFRRPGWAVVADLAAGTRQPMFRWAHFANTVIVVADPTHKSLLSGRRLVKVGTHLIANRVRSQADVDRITAAIALPLIATVPYDEELAHAEQLGLAPIDAVPGSAAVRVISDLAARLVEEST